MDWDEAERLITSGSIAAEKIDVANVVDLKRDIILDCQKILAAYLPPDGPSAHDTISALLEILDGPRAREALG